MPSPRVQRVRRRRNDRVATLRRSLVESDMLRAILEGSTKREEPATLRGHQATFREQPHHPFLALHREDTGEQAAEPKFDITRRHPATSCPTMDRRAPSRRR